MNLEPPELLRVLGDSVITGPTLTNVNDFRAILINAQTAEPQSRPRDDTAASAAVQC
jgi:hypothetical protein